MEWGPPEAYASRKSGRLRGGCPDLDHVVRDPDGTLFVSAEGKGESMDLLPSPGDDCNEVPENDRVDFTGFKIIEATDDCFRQFGQARHLTSRSDLDEVDGPASDAPGLPAPSRSLEGRFDIDAAMVEALERVMVFHGPGTLTWGAQPEGSFGDATRSDGTVQPRPSDLDA
jgi:hypothetical protein